MRPINKKNNQESLVDREPNWLINTDLQFTWLTTNRFHKYLLPVMQRCSPEVDRRWKLWSMHWGRKGWNLGHGEACRSPEDDLNWLTGLSPGRHHSQYAYRCAWILGPRQQGEPPSRWGRNCWSCWGRVRIFNRLLLGSVSLSIEHCCSEQACLRLLTATLVEEVCIDATCSNFPSIQCNFSCSAHQLGYV